MGGDGNLEMAKTSLEASTESFCATFFHRAQIESVDQKNDYFF